jgi:hypothetical protein
MFSIPGTIRLARMALIGRGPDPRKSSPYLIAPDLNRFARRMYQTMIAILSITYNNVTYLSSKDPGLLPANR